MEKEFSDSFWLGVDTIGSVVLVMFLLGIMSASTTLFNSFETREVTEMKVADAKEWKYYDEGKNIPAADVISCLNKYNSLDEVKCIAVKPISIPKGTSSVTGVTQYKRKSTDVSVTFTDSVGNTWTAVVGGSGTDNANDYWWNPNMEIDTSNPTAHKVVTGLLSEVINITSTYSCHIGRDGTGVVTHILFVEESP